MNRCNFPGLEGTTHWASGVGGAALTGAVGLVLLLTGCTRPNPDNPALDLGAPEVSWSAKQSEQRLAFMAAQVHPTMKKLFREYDADEFGNFRCQTCHGDDMEAVDFRMPNSLYPLPKDNPLAEAMDTDEDVAQFMMAKVVPTMKRLLDQGSGPKHGADCFTCHPTE